MDNRKQIRIPQSSILGKYSSDWLQEQLEKITAINMVNFDQNLGSIVFNYDPGKIDFLDIFEELERLGIELVVENLRLKVEGMRCISCISHVEGALNEVPGVVNSSAKPSENLAEVVFVKNMVTAEELVYIVNQTGYHASL